MLLLPSFFFQRSACACLCEIVESTQKPITVLSLLVTYVTRKAVCIIGQYLHMEDCLPACLRNTEVEERFAGIKTLGGRSK